MRGKVLASVFLFVFVPSLVWAESKVDLYVFNQHFSGKVFAVKKNVFVEAFPLFMLLKLNVKKENKNETLVSWNQKMITIPLHTQNKTAYVSLKKIGKALGLAWDYNPQTSIADLYQPRAVQSFSPLHQDMSASTYNVEVVESSEEKGIDEMAVTATVVNKGSNTVPGVIVVCSFYYVCKML
jgi:hypothetical protein